MKREFPPLPWSGQRYIQISLLEFPHWMALEEQQILRCGEGAVLKNHSRKTGGRKKAFKGEATGDAHA